jgi:murein DD-endopeptidase MepM/ murein hydrolase activator NlpD
MAKSGKTPKVEHFRISLIDDMTHKQMWVMRFTRTGLFLFIISVITVIMAASFSIVAFTPIRTFIPGYPTAHTKRAAIENALKIDSLQNVIYTWKFYSENLKRVIDGQEPVSIDSLIRSYGGSNADAASRESLDGQDSVLRENVRKAEQFGLSKSGERQLPIEGMHFFTPLKGVISQGYDRLLHPYIDITAPANSVVMSVLDGTVINAGWSDDSGYTIQIQHSDDIVSIYKHNQKLLKKTGDKVSAGTPIALVGNTGALTTGDHLHFELWYRGEAIDPTKYINF